MIGISGGAWTTTIASAIDARISKSFPVSGPLPMYIDANLDHSFGDYEVINPRLNKIATMLDLYILGSSGKGREQLKIINKYDSCCHYGMAYLTFYNFLEKKSSILNNTRFQVYVDETTNKHEISDKTLEVIYDKIKL